MKETKQYPLCSCGQPRPYRRAFQCAKCWAATKASSGYNSLLKIGRATGLGTLRLGQSIDNQLRKA